MLLASLGLGWAIDRQLSAGDLAFFPVRIDGNVYLDCSGELNGLPGIVYLKPSSPTAVIPGQRLKPLANRGIRGGVFQAGEEDPHLASGA